MLCQKPLGNLNLRFIQHKRPGWSDSDHLVTGYLLFCTENPNVCLRVLGPSGNLGYACLIPVQIRSPIEIRRRQIRSEDAPISVILESSLQHPRQMDGIPVRRCDGDAGTICGILVCREAATAALLPKKRRWQTAFSWKRTCIKEPWTLLCIQPIQNGAGFLPGHRGN